MLNKILESRQLSIQAAIDSSLVTEKSLQPAQIDSKPLKTSKEALEKIRLNKLILIVYKIINFVIKIFNSKYEKIDSLFATNVLANRLIQNYTDLLKDPDASIDDLGFVYDASFERLEAKLDETSPNTPLRIAMVGMEFAGLVKQGGLAEAIEGLSSGLQTAFPDNQLSLIFPKYRHLPENVKGELGEGELFQHKDLGNYLVYEYTLNGITCYFIEDPSFDLDPNQPNVYTVNGRSDHLAKFSSLAADFLYRKKQEIDVIHLHDWHVAGVLLKMKQDHPNEWTKKEVPSFVFTYHNNHRSAQGRLGSGPYNYESTLEAYRALGITGQSDNLFVRTLLDAHAVTTVSKVYAEETQEIETGEGVSFAVRTAARTGKLTGILNGANLKRWNPETDTSLKTWKDVETDEAIDLTFKAEKGAYSQKLQAKGQLKKWVEKFLPETQFDFSKPIVTYIGRFDSVQKGLEKFDEAIGEILAQSGQFICMGTDPDKKAQKILNTLKKKYPKGVLFLEDYRTPQGALYFQQGDLSRPGIGSLVRATTDFSFIPSKFEPCGLVQFEGWQFGALAIGTKTGGLQETIQEDSNGYLFESSPKKALSKALTLWMSQSVEQREEKIIQVMQEVQKAGWENTAKKYQIVYRTSIKRKKEELTLPTTIESLKFRRVAKRIETLPQVKELLQEEGYFKDFYNPSLKREELIDRFETFPSKIRTTLPSPYGISVDYEKYKKLGALSNPDGTTSFTLSAPQAKEVTLLLFDSEEKLTNSIPMEKTALDWRTTQSVPEGQLYQFQINGNLKIDPYGKQHIPSKKRKEDFYSVVTNSNHAWTDDQWITKRNLSRKSSKPLNILEIHPNTWKKKEDSSYLNYRELAREVLLRCKEEGYTHIELMGILEHPVNESLGYQVYGYFAPTSRHGSLDDFKYLVNFLHENGVGVILDWVPAHFASEKFGLKSFDGSSQYEASGLKYFFSIRNFFFKYGSYHFNFKSKEVREFLISSALYWIHEMHIDALRVDCVTSLLSTEDSKSAELFIKDLNTILHRHGKGALSIAEDFSGHLKATLSPSLKGLGFDLKWHSGFMHQMFAYFKTPPSQRKNLYNFFKKGVSCDDFHKQVLFISHDQEKAYQKLFKSLDPEDKEKQARALISMLMMLPGKKLQFMTLGEKENRVFWRDLISKESSGWFDQHSLDPNFQKMRKRLHDLYIQEQALQEFDSNGKDLEWVEDPNQAVIAYKRISSKGDHLFCLHNFTEKERTLSWIGLRVSHQILFQSNAEEFGGSNEVELLHETVKLPPLTSVILKEVSNDK